jgi:hypothetical protein
MLLLRQRSQTDNTVDLVIFPELSVPLISIKTLYRFIRQTGAFVLAGLELRKNKAGTRQINELMWIVPLDENRQHLTSLLQEKIHVTDEEKKLQPPVVEATPAVIWRIHCRKGRMAAINCYEFTDLEIRNLLRGRIEALVIAANNKDITTFDNLVESTHYDLFSHVILVNAEKYGGSAVRAPYKIPQERRIFDIHGNELFAVNIISLNLLDFRGSRSAQHIKTRPAGFVEIYP